MRAKRDLRLISDGMYRRGNVIDADCIDRAIRELDARANAIRQAHATVRLALARASEPHATTDDVRGILATLDVRGSLAFKREE